MDNNSNNILNQKKKKSGMGFYIFLMLLIVGLIIVTKIFDNLGSGYGYKQYIDDLSDGDMKTIVIVPNEEVPTGVISVTLSDEKTYSFNCLNIEEAWKAAMDAGYEPIVKNVSKPGWFVSNFLPVLGLGVVMFLMVTMLINQSNGGGNSKMMNFGKSRAKLYTDLDKQKTFADVAGLMEEKEDLEEIVDFLKDPKKYTNLGARIPKGVILVGPPGTGKTLLAKAVAGEARVPFFSISGSDFVEMFVGVGASRVRDLFDNAKRNAPCIVFIDEIDAVARRRGSGLGGGHDEREQTLNQMLVEMDGFGVNEGIIVMAATNRVDILDPAILRPGRFDRKINVGRPDVRAREEILGVHIKHKPLGEDVNIKDIARTTPGFTGADLENLMNESAINAARENRKYINNSDVQKSLIKIGVGTEKKSKLVSEKEKRITAFHEAGHAILFHILPDVGPVHMISVIPTGDSAAGYTMPVPAQDEMFSTKGKMFQEIQASLGGRIAEELIFDDVTTGASADIKQATELARRMVIRYGFSDNIGLINYETDDDEVFIGRNLAHARGYGDDVADKIDKEVRNIIMDAYSKAKAIMIEYKSVLFKSAELLMEKERIGREEFEALFDTLQ